ncbi:GNAT family N-acetyltransferase [Bdellovibrio sp. SKB1291214]|uniref:GNAT family N-acetyltransferase n=1 Tax=Bdellovibrio sp. SKB1291214 TaxID=1732569 RepID=UPI000B51A972|nr:GNAT family N-acetyltransferase [Bdellovibrio sp. SKB1291214]UYL10199.1 GNAT family N-acetyltransferase [Bdellovibrio sp. SKB1291214]
MSNISFKTISAEELSRIHELHFNNVFSNRTTAPGFFIVESEQNKINERRRKYAPWELLVGIYDGETPIGWHVGYATDPETFYMKNSAVLSEYRNRGIYSKLLEFVLTEIQREGFQVVTSIHHGNNPAVLIPKLKRGFIISGTHFHEKFRFMIELKYFMDSARKKAYGKSMGLEL